MVSGNPPFPAPASRWISARGVRLHLLEWGDPAAPPLVCVHGAGAHAHWWAACAPRLAARFRLLACDLRGHGRSAPAPDGAYDVAAHAADLAAWTAALRLGPLHLVGHSLGGLIALAHAAAHPGAVLSLTCVDSPLRISPATAAYLARLARFPVVSFRSLEDAIRRFRLVPAATSATPAVLRHVATHALRRTPDGRWTRNGDRAALAGLAPVDLRPALRQLACPILLVRGAHSAVLPSGAFRRLAALVPHAACAEIPDAHHHVMLDQPGLFAATLISFLTGLRSQAMHASPPSRCTP